VTVFSFYACVDVLAVNLSSLSQKEGCEPAVINHCCYLLPDVCETEQTLRDGAVKPSRPFLDSDVIRLGRPGVDCYCQHESGAAVLQLQFLINEGALVTACADDTLHLWNLRQRRPAVLHSLKFNRERITFCHLPFQSKWLYVGTERGNTHIVNIESFILSGYVIMWNKAIELFSLKFKEFHFIFNLLIGFESGTVVQWDLRGKKADFRIYYDEAIHSVSWHHEGKQFMCSHSDGSLTLWNLRNTTKPFQVTFPHGKIQKDARKESCKPILKVEYKTSRNRSDTGAN
uniref:Syntaxin binding protein 5L n=1 Tax=Cynoglossus semilaevis TaxID=244447 RepID=A0A3P8W9U1_CYNSE